MKHAPLAAISETVGEAWSTGSEIARDLGTSAIERAGALASTAADSIPELSKNVNRLARRNKRRARLPARWPMLLVIIAAAGVFVIVAARRRRNSTVRGEDAVPVPGEYTGRAVATAGY